LQGWLRRSKSQKKRHDLFAGCRIKSKIMAEFGHDFYK
jgi:hypothetical protein